jgi:hypothetical protein
MHSVRSPRRARHRRAGPDRNPLFLKPRSGEPRDLLVFRRKDPQKHFDHGDLRSKSAVEGPEFDADRACANDKQVLRHPLRRLQAKQDSRPAPVAITMVRRIVTRAERAGRLVGARPARSPDGLSHAQASRRRRTRLAPDRLDLVLFQQAGAPRLKRPETARERCTIASASDVVGEAIILRMAHELENFGRAQ